MQQLYQDFITFSENVPRFYDFKWSSIHSKRILLVLPIIKLYKSITQRKI